MYKLGCDPAQKLVIAEIDGFLTVEDVEAFSSCEQDMVRQMGYSTDEYLLMVITEDAVIQSQDVVAKFMDIVANSPMKAKRVAVVRGGSLTRMQTQRILSTRSNAAIFVTREEAETWLFDQADIAAA